jgi:oxygen-dependent protoporphyrinogen oxidase
MTRATVIGAGLSGLAAAWQLLERNIAVHVVDAADRPGGLIRTIDTPHGLVETGANAFVRTPLVDALFHAVDLEPCEPLPAARRRYVFRRGRARRWPLTGIETASSAARLGAAWISSRHRPRDSESVAAWGARVLGPAAVRWLVGPALQGVYGAQPDRLCASAVLGTRRRRSTLVAPPGGMGQLIDRLTDVLRRRGVSFEWSRAMSEMPRDEPVVVAVPAPAAAQLLGPHAPGLAAAIARIEMTSLTTASAFFEPRADDLRGFGVLFPRGEGVAALGVLFAADIFAGRSALRSETWIYGAGVVAADEMIAADRAVLTTHAQSPVAICTTRRPSALPVYGEAVREVASRLSDLPPGGGGAGTYLGRMGGAGLVDTARDAARRIAGGC